MEIFDPLNPNAPGFEDAYRRLAKSGSPPESAIAKMMLEFLDVLRRGIVGPRLGARQMGLDWRDLWLTYSDGCGHHTLITANVNYKDRSPLIDGVPLLHYRLTYTRPLPNAPENTSTVELRTRDVGTAYEFVLEAIQQCKPAS